MQTFFLIIIACASIFSGCSHAPETVRPVGCDSNPKLQAEKSEELLELVKEDQADRSGPYDSMDWNKINPRDLKRRVKVAAIFAEGCFQTSTDYASAAMIYQHGTTADHYYQAFLWASEAFKLGDESQRWMTAAALDRYLIQAGQMQLFGTQLGKDTAGKFCIKPVEPSFPSSRRVQYIKQSLKGSIANTLKAIGSNQSADDIKNCDMALKASPVGTVPGFW